jgi:hypothetical protein
LPVHTLAPLSSSAHNPAAGDAPLSEAVQKLNELKNLLEGADYATFWSTLDSDDLYADLIADVSGFEELMRVRIAATVSQAVREVDQSILELSATCVAGLLRAARSRCPLTRTMRPRALLSGRASSLTVSLAP